MECCISQAVVCISGFLQREGTSANGITHLWADLFAKWSSPRSLVALYTWDCRPDGIAELLFRVLRPHSPLVITGYSWGGHASIRLCEQLQERGMNVSHLVLSDPVFRPWFTLGRWRAMLPMYTHIVPQNVKRVTWFRQYEDWPRAHNVAAADSSVTAVAPPRIAKVRHTLMDNYPAYHAKVKEIVSSEFLVRGE